MIANEEVLRGQAGQLGLDDYAQYNMTEAFPLTRGSTYALQHEIGIHETL